MQLVLAIVGFIATLVALMLLLTAIIFGVFFLFNLVPWNGIRRRPGSQLPFRGRPPLAIEPPRAADDDRTRHA